MNDYKTKSCLIMDFGVFTEFAVKLAESFGKTYYYTPWEGCFPSSRKRLIGYGLEGITRINNFWDYVDEADIIVFPDVSCGHIQTYLAKQGKAVWGSRKGEELELYRAASKGHLQSIGASVGAYEVVTGTAALRQYLKENDNQWVKVNMRGDTESFQSLNYTLIETKLDALEHFLGGSKHIMEFIVEEAIENAVEIGSDMYCIDGQYPSASLCGIEIKDRGYIARFKDFDDMPIEITMFNKQIANTLKKYNYRNFISSELRVIEDHTPYIIDPCMRLGSPPSEIYINMFKNLADIVWEGAHGRCIDPIVEEPCAMELVIKSSWADDNWIMVNFPEEVRENFKFRDLCKIENNYYIIPSENGHPEIGTVVATGDSFEEVYDKIIEYSGMIQGYGISVCLEVLDEVKIEIEKVNSLGIDLL